MRRLALVMTLGLLLLFVAPVLIGTFAVVLGAMAIAAIAFLAGIPFSATPISFGNLQVNTVGTKLLATGAFDRAQHEIEAAVRLKPDFAEARRDLADILAAKGGR